MFAVVGAVLLVISVRGAQQRIEQLKSWTRVDARVHGGEVVSLSRGGRRKAAYAERLNLEYDLGGQKYEVAATEEVYSSDYAGQARGVQRAARAGVVKALVDPLQPTMPLLNAGYNPEYFFDSLLFGLIGSTFLALSILIWRAVRTERAGAKGGSASGAWLLVFLAVMGVLFTAGGGFAFHMAQREMSWKPIDARVDSTDVVWTRSSGGSSSAVDVYAARAWITYNFRDSTFHVPVVRGVYSNDSDGAARDAATLKRAGTLNARFDPGNAFNARVGRPGAVGRFWVPMLFMVPGLVCLYLTWVLGRKKPKRRRRKVRRPVAVEA